ncbi:MAG: hypothetical protein Q8L52_01280 [bacterium]|nr:hypothetical protein [bacterium]
MAQASKQAKTVRELEARLEVLQTLQRTAQQNASQWRAEIKRLSEQVSGAERDCRNATNQITETMNRLFVRSALTPELLNARRNCLAQIRRSGDDKISVRKQKELQASNTIALASLQKLCTHPFVFSYDGYGGSRLMDYDDAYYGHRVCALCNLHETSAATRNDIYAVLVEDNTRLVRRDLRKRKDLPIKRFEQEWFLTGFLQQLFEASAGGINIEWPKFVDEKPS